MQVEFSKQILIGLFILGLVSCETKEQTKIPKELDKALITLNENWSAKEKEKFKTLPEEDAVINLHFSTGMWIRNNWIYGNRDTSLVNYFNQLGIFHPDDMSSIILTSFHRKLNNKDIKLNEQIAYYKAYWLPIIECENGLKEEALDNYNKYKIGIKITILMKVDTSSRQRNAVILMCPSNEWSFNQNIDLMINGIVKEKFFINDSSNVFFKVLIEKMNNENTLILGKNVKIGDVFDFSLRGLKIK